MRKLRVDVEELAMCMETQERVEQNYYLDMETGEILLIPSEILEALEEGESLDKSLDGQLQVLGQAREIFAGNPRFVEIPVRPSGEAYRMMVDFAQGLKEGLLKEKVESAVHGKGAFRRFKDLLIEYPDTQKEWFGFKAERDKGSVRDWLESIGIEMEEK